MSANKDVKNKLKFVTSIVPLLRTADVNGAGVDLQDSNGAALVAHLGASGDTLSASVYLAMEVQHSDDNSTFTACADADIDTAVASVSTGTFAKIIANASLSAMVKCNYLGSKRYVRVVGNLVGTHTNGLTFGAHAVLASTVQPQA